MQMQMNAVNTKWTDLLTDRVIDERKRDEKQKMKNSHFPESFGKTRFQINPNQWTLQIKRNRKKRKKEGK